MHNKRRMMKKRYKRLATAVAGAAIMGAALLPSAPAMARNIEVRPAVTAAQSVGAVSSDPIQVAIDNAGRYGLDANGHYSVISQNDSKAIVKVRSDGQTYKVDLVQRDGNWVVKAIRGIGDAHHPATYVSANSYYNPVVTVNPVVTTGVTAATLGVSDHVIYQNNNYDTWTWNQDGYPKDMAFGVILQNPQIASISTPLPANLINSISHLDFYNRLVVYAHLGTTNAQGYGIGISRIDQSGNELTVTVRAKSPLAGATLTGTQSDSYVAIDRSLVDMGAPIHVNFVDINGTVLGSYTVNAS